METHAPKDLPKAGRDRHFRVSSLVSGSQGGTYLLLKGLTRTATVTWLLSTFKGSLSAEVPRTAVSSWGGSVCSWDPSLLFARREAFGFGRTWKPGVLVFGVDVAGLLSCSVPHRGVGLGSAAHLVGVLFSKLPRVFVFFATSTPMLL